MSDTSQTDAAKFTTYSTRHGKYIEAVQVDFARSQERRIAELECERDDAYAKGFAVGSGHEGEYQRRIAELERGEYICKSCGHRKDGEADVIPEF